MPGATAGAAAIISHSQGSGAAAAGETAAAPGMNLVSVNQNLNQPQPAEQGGTNAEAGGTNNVNPPAGDEAPPAVPPPMMGVYTAPSAPPLTGSGTGFSVASSGGGGPNSSAGPLPLTPTASAGKLFGVHELLPDQLHHEGSDEDDSCSFGLPMSVRTPASMTGGELRGLRKSRVPGETLAGNRNMLMSSGRGTSNVHATNGSGGAAQEMPLFSSAGAVRAANKGGNDSGGRSGRKNEMINQNRENPFLHAANAGSGDLILAPAHVEDANAIPGTSGGGGSSSSASSGISQSSLRRVRRRVQAAFRAHLFPTAIFLADKVFSLSQEKDDLFTLAECLFQNKEFARVIFLLTHRHPDAAKSQDRLRLLVVQSYLEAGEFEEALRYLDEHCLPSGIGIEQFERGDNRAVFAYLKGRVFEHFENRESAVNCYKLAVQYDPFLYEASSRLLGTGLLSSTEEERFLNKLQLEPEDEWMRVIYRAKSSSSSVSYCVPLHEQQHGGTSNSDCEGNNSSLSTFSKQSTFTAEHILKRKPGIAQRRRRGPRQKRQRLSLQPLEDCKKEEPLVGLPERLHTNAYVLGTVAEKYFQQGDYTSSYVVSKSILERDPYELEVLPCHIASLLMTENKTLVFYIAHQLINAYPQYAVAWFAAGCYYYLSKRYDAARKFFGKATLLDHNFTPAWIAYGHSFSLQEESDQALAAYRTASRLFPGSHVPWLYLGMEYLRSSNFILAQQALHMGLTIAPKDPNLLNEMAVCAFERHEYTHAVAFLERVQELGGVAQDGSLDAFLENLAHAYLKCQEYEKALDFFHQALAASNQGSASAHCGVGFVRHINRELHAAVESYHRALALQPDDPFAQEMLGYAIQECVAEPDNDALLLL
ncbi:unnamed protein product [Amoebophrya sp. A120]|nr:unnamed protein product [Amoebophrya sp. A120]|eukprot:GSA120T00003521001.1